MNNGELWIHSEGYGTLNNSSDIFSIFSPRISRQPKRKPANLTHLDHFVPKQLEEQLIKNSRLVVRSRTWVCGFHLKDFMKSSETSTLVSIFFPFLKLLVEEEWRRQKVEESNRLALNGWTCFVRFSVPEVTFGLWKRRERRERERAIKGQSLHYPFLFLLIFSFFLFDERKLLMHMITNWNKFVPRTESEAINLYSRVHHIIMHLELEPINCCLLGNFVFISENKGFPWSFKKLNWQSRSLGLCLFHPNIFSFWLKVTFSDTFVLLNKDSFLMENKKSFQSYCRLA